MSHHYSGPDFGFPRGDARLDFTDLYAFPKPSDASKSILVMNVHPSDAAHILIASPQSCVTKVPKKTITKIKGDHKETKNEKPEFTSTEDSGDTVVSTLASILASHI